MQKSLFGKCFSRKHFFVLSYFAYASIYIARLNLTIASPVMQEQGLLTSTQVGAMGGAFFLCYCAGQLLNGFLGRSVSAAEDGDGRAAADRYGKYSDRLSYSRRSHPASVGYQRLCPVHAVGPAASGGFRPFSGREAGGNRLLPGLLRGRRQCSRHSDRCRCHFLLGCTVRLSAARPHRGSGRRGGLSLFPFPLSLRAHRCICSLLRFQIRLLSLHTGRARRRRLFARKIFGTLLSQASDFPAACHVSRRSEG